MRVTEGLRILDLRKPYLVDSPFFHENLGWRLEAHGLLNRFAEELARPVMPHEADILYRPTQHLCDVIKAGGFDGIAYPSAWDRDITLSSLILILARRQKSAITGWKEYDSRQEP